MSTKSQTHQNRLNFQHDFVSILTPVRLPKAEVKLDHYHTFDDITNLHNCYMIACYNNIVIYLIRAPREA